ncbi:hypothetical protein [Gallaecimonas xiamenensis]|uniref:Uncharacterized protein n=1 Tax=Gallaecimonas xiamenensis 3-C-1 TaxID=745411 RepID=K2KHI6_9GAMM|nr:hypothetical protein [Gallaecimonas xiamenensis]EKE76735.1 hypothetical protein B3C1_04040 [Gallaecimonas xiamenensis 3-C-1]
MLLSSLLFAAQLAQPFPSPYSAQATRLCELAVRGRLGMVRTDHLQVQHQNQLVVVSGTALKPRDPITFVCEFTLDEQDQLHLTKLELLALSTAPAGNTQL